MKSVLAQILMCCMLLISGCVSLPDIRMSDTEEEKHQEDKAKKVLSFSRALSLTVQDRLALHAIELDDKQTQQETNVYSFQANNLGIKNALSLFARMNGFNVIADPDVTGKVSVNFNALTFDQAMSAILDVHGYYWKKKGSLITVHNIETRTFSIDYLRLTRSNKGSSNASVSTGSSSGGKSGSVSLENEDKIDFWDDLQKQLNMMISEKTSRLVVDKMSGTIQLTDTHRRVENVAEFLARVAAASRRQIEIDVEIVEVALNKDSSLGIDWSRVNLGKLGVNFVFNTATAIANTSAGRAVAGSTFNGTVTNTTRNGDVVSAVINALKKQGDVKVISKPRIRTLNNQSAMIKVGTDRTFFTKTQATNTTAAGATTQSTDTPIVVTEGIVLHVTPQISSDNWVFMDISPVITRVASVSTAVDSNGNVTSTAPNLDIRQSASMVRVMSGQHIVLGGLIQDESSGDSRSIPVLGDIPGLGNLFSSKYKSSRKKELVIFMTPHVIGLENEYRSAF